MAGFPGGNRWTEGPRPPGSRRPGVRMHIGVYFDAFAPSIAPMPGDFDHSDFVDPDFEASGRPVTSSASAAIATATPTVSAATATVQRTGPMAFTSAAVGSMNPVRPPSREEINQQVTAAQQALVELKQKQEELERERSQLEEARRRRLEFEQGREEMLAHLTRGIGLLEESEQNARRDAEQMSRTLVDLRSALEKVKSLHEESWTAETYATELTRALTSLENARMEWNSAQMKWTVLSGRNPNSPGTAPVTPGENAPLPLGHGRTPAELARLGLALTWPVAVAVLLSGLVLALMLARR